MKPKTMAGIQKQPEQQVENQQTASPEQIVAKLSGQFSAINGILNAIGGDVGMLLNYCIALLKENQELKQKLSKGEK